MTQEQVVIVGGGPAGSVMGAYLSRAGVRNIILESAIHPRAHVGESLVTASTRVLEEIGVLGEVERSGFVKKFGASWHPPTASGSVYVKFSEVFQEGIRQDHTYHVDRSKFDLMLLKHAERLGSRVVQGVKVKDVIFDGDRACGVKVDVAGSITSIPASVVIDASGRQTLIGNQLNLKQNDPLLNQFAVHAWFHNVDRGNRPDDIHIYFMPIKRGWVWQIPITEDLTSVGVVAERDLFRQGKRDHQGWFFDIINSAPATQFAMRNATAANDFKVEADYSYKMRQLVGNGWVLVGDAARFVDPIFSSGVSVAMHCAKFASQQLLETMSKGILRPSREDLLPYEERVLRGTQIWYEFICLYYKLRSVFTYFISKPEYRGQVIDLLQGNVYARSEVPVLNAMREFIATIESSPGHVLRAFLDPDIDAADTAVPKTVS